MNEFNELEGFGLGPDEQVDTHNNVSLVDEMLEEIDSEMLGKYEIIGHSEVFDKLGNAIAPLAIGEVYEFSVEYGNDLVERGIAKRV